MKVTGLSTKALQFEGSFGEQSFATESGVLIRFVEIDDWIHVMIDVGEDTTSNDLKEAIPLAINWRNRLLEWQGPWLRGGRNRYLEILSQRHENGQSYRILAKEINQKIVECLEEFNEYVKELEAAHSEFNKISDFYLWQPKANQFSLDHARYMLQALRLKEEEIEELLQIGFERIKVGEIAFEEGYPIDGEKLRNTLRSWREGRKHLIAKAMEEEITE